MNKPPTNPWEDLTEVVSLPYRDEEGQAQTRAFRLREMSRAECDRLTDFYFAGVDKLKDEAGALNAEQMSTAELVKRGFSLQWECLDEALQFILREPTDGGEPPTTEWIRAQLNQRRAELLIETQDRLNGTDKVKKKAEELTRAMVLDSAAKNGSFSTIISPPDTVDSQTTFPDVIPTGKPDF